jgi:hypothetical protein
MSMSWTKAASTFEAMLGDIDECTSGARGMRVNAMCASLSRLLRILSAAISIHCTIAIFIADTTRLACGGSRTIVIMLLGVGRQLTNDRWLRSEPRQ